MRKFLGRMLLKLTTRLAAAFGCQLITDDSIRESAAAKAMAISILQASSKSNRRFARKIAPFIDKFSMMRLSAK